MMIARWPCIMISTLCCVLAVAASASAWVMWEVNAISGGGNLETGWSIAETWDTKVQCQEATRRVVQRWKDAGLDVRNDAVVIESKTGLRIVRGFQCLPDTVDPRRPKPR